MLGPAETATAPPNARLSIFELSSASIVIAPGASTCRPPAASLSTIVASTTLWILFSPTAAAAAPLNVTLPLAEKVRPSTQIAAVELADSGTAAPESTFESAIFARVVLPMSSIATDTPTATDDEKMPTEKAAAIAPATAPMSDVSPAVGETSLPG